MRYVVVPPPVEGLGVDSTGAPASYPFVNFLREFSWKNPLWTEHNGAVESFLRIAPAFESAEPGARVPLLDADFELLQRAVVAGVVNFPPIAVLSFMKFVHAVTSAKSE